MGPNMKTQNALWLAFIAVFVNLAMFYVLGPDTTILTLQVIVLGVAVTVSVSWFPAAIQAIRRSASSAADKIVLSVWSAWTVLVLQRVYALFLTVYDRPDALVRSPISSLVTTLIIVAGVYAAYATVTDTDVPVQERSWVIFATAVGSFVAGALATIFIVTGFRPFG